MPDPLFQPPFQLAPQNLLLFISLFLMERAIASAVRRRQLLAALALIVSSIMSRQCALLATLSVEEAVQLVAIQLPVALAAAVPLSDLTEAVAAALVGPAQGPGPGGRLDRTRAWWKEFVEDPERWNNERFIKYFRVRLDRAPPALQLPASLNALGTV